MKTILPSILGAGYFDSRKKFPKVKQTQPRTVDCYELELFFEDGGYSVINNQKHQIKKGGILFAKPNDIRYSLLPFKCIFLHFDNLPEDFIKRFEAFPCFFESENFEKIYEDVTQIIKLYCSADSVNNICATAKLLLLLKDIQTPKSEENNIALKAKLYIHNNYNEDLNIDSIAEHCNISASYLHKVFSKIYGIGPAEALVNRRIYKAKDLIINTDLSFCEIAYICGFHSQSYFSDCFKRKNGITPREFKQKNIRNFDIE